jgi:hypothetical protein
MQPKMVLVDEVMLDERLCKSGAADDEYVLAGLPL